MRKRLGFTLVEVVLTCALLSLLLVLVGGAFLNIMQVSAREQAALEMDQDAIRILETLKQTLRASYIPVAESPLTVGRKDILAATSLASNVGQWRKVLTNGADLFVFVVGLDTEGDGDIIYGDSQESRRLAFGIDPPGNPGGFREATDKNDTLSNLGLVDVNPVTAFDLPTSNSSSISIAAARFAENFVFPTGARQHIYGVVRFVPFRESGTTTVVLNEGTLRTDLNGDGDQTDEFVLGRLQIVYPRTGGGTIVTALSGNTVLLQINRNDSPQNSLFQLVESKSKKGSVLKVNLLMCNYSTQNRDKVSFAGGRLPLMARTYESSIKTQLMMAE